MRRICASLALSLAAFVSVVPSAHADSGVTSRTARFLERPSQLVLRLLPSDPSGQPACRNNVYLPVWQAPATVPCVLALDIPHVLDVAQSERDKRPPRFASNYRVPPLLYYQSPDPSRADVALSLMPGGPCTAACIKLAGSF